MRYRIFGHGTGLRVSEQCLGTALFGTAWGYGADADEAARIFDTFADAGGNFVDTADSYQFGDAERILGTLLSGRRDRFVLASKYTLGAHAEANPATTGNSRKNLARSIEDSLGRLATDRLDILWVHMDDTVTASDEIMRGLEDAVRQGKLLYVGFSNFAAWRVARAATLAEWRGWIRPIAIQIEYSLAERGADRELLPMADALGLAVTAWSPLGGGLLTGKYRRGESGRATAFGRIVHREDSPARTALLDTLTDVAGEQGATMSQVALAWLAARGIVPVIGPRTVAQLVDNLGARQVSLTTDQIARLGAASATVLGYPHDFLAEPAQFDAMAGGDPGRIVWPAHPVV